MRNNIVKPKKFYVVEGVDGSGKTTLVSKLNKEPVTVLRYPGYTEFGKKIREFLLLGTGQTLPNIIKAKLMIVDFFLTQNAITNPESKIILADRYFISTFIYQIFDGTFECFEKFSALVEGLWVPDKVFLLNIDTDVVLKSLRRREDKMMFDREDQVLLHADRYQKFIDFIKVNDFAGIPASRFTVFSGDYTAADALHDHIETLILQDSDER